MFLMAGEKVYVLRSVKGTYLRLSNGKLIAVRNNSANSRIPGMSVRASQDLTKEQLQGLVYSFVKLPGQKFGNDSFSDLNVYPPTEQPLPPSPSFFTQNKNHLQVTNSRNTSGGDVTLWQPLLNGISRNSEPENNNGYMGHVSRNVDRLSYENTSKSFSGLSDSSTSPFNSNLERLSFLANRFPGFPQNPELVFPEREKLNHRISSNFDSPIHPFLSSSPSCKPSSVNGSRSSERAEMELIPIKKSSSNSGKLQNARVDSPLLFRSHKPAEPSSTSRNLQNCSTASFPNNTTNTSPAKLLDFNPSFYKDFTITCKNSTASNGSSSGSESLVNSSAQQSSSRRMTESTQNQKSSSWLNKIVPGDNATQLNDSSVEKATEFSQNATSTCSDVLFSNHKVADYFSQFSTKVNHQETDFGGQDFRDSSQYYSDNMSGNTLEDGGTSRHEGVPVYFPNHGA